jgi:2-dehydro-3-deoxyphosphogluconate aldolase / (4S)-4-hydroxy-2-oxoglutarate aldolase
VANAPAYLKLANVVTIGGSWMAPKQVVAAKDWGTIEALARAAVQLRPR